MNIYLIERPEEEVTWDENNACIVYAKSKLNAFDVVPWTDEWCADGRFRQGRNVKITYLGKAKAGTKSRVILNDYNAG